MLTPERLLEQVNELVKQNNEQLIVFWYEVSDGDRDAFCQKLEAMVSGSWAIPVVLRAGLFLDPNGIAADINRLLSDLRERIVRLGPAPIPESYRLVLILLSRSAFKLPQISSPAVLPSWVPSVGGRTVMSRIIDVLRSALGPLSSPEAPVDDMCRELHTLDAVLTRRLMTVAALDARAGGALAAVASHGNSSPNVYKEFLVSALAYNRSIGSPEGFRPSVKELRCVTALLLQMFKSSTPDGLNRPAEILKGALKLEIDPEMSGSDSILAVLFRPVQYDADPGKRFARNLLICVYAAVQLVTAKAHADAYPRFPLMLLQVLVRDLRQGILRATAVIESLGVAANGESDS